MNDHEDVIWCGDGTPNIRQVAVISSTYTKHHIVIVIIVAVNSCKSNNTLNCLFCNLVEYIFMFVIWYATYMWINIIDIY